MQQLKQERIQLGKLVFHEQRHLTSHVKVVHGMVLDQGPRDVQAPRNVQNGAVLVLAEALELPKLGSSTHLEFSSAQERVDLVQAERWHFVDGKVKKMIELGAQVVICTEAIDAHALQVLAENKILALRHVQRDKAEIIAKATNATIVHDVMNASNSALGKVGQVTVVEHENELYDASCVDNI